MDKSSFDSSHLVVSGIEFLDRYLGSQVSNHHKNINDKIITEMHVSVCIRTCYPPTTSKYLIELQIPNETEKRTEKKKTG